MEPTTALFPLCTHTKPDGNRCASPALKGMNFCFQHIGGNLSAMTRARATTSSPGARLNFAYPGDRQAIQHNLSLVAQALSDGKIDTVMANTYNRIYRTCEQNLHRWEKAQQKAGSEEKQMRPLSDEAPESNQQDGAPLQPDGASLQPDGGSLKPASGLSGEQKPAFLSMSSVANPPESAPQQSTGSLPTEAQPLTACAAGAQPGLQPPAS